MIAKTKMIAVLMVLVMAFSVVPLATTDTLDATVGDGGTYSYTLHYDSSTMSQTAAQELQITVEDMTPISHAANTTTLASLDEGSWTWNETTGVGPFNSFYVAFDMTNGNRSVGKLDPYDLTKKIDGTSLDDMTKYNIMWVLPTVYWSVDANGDLTLTNNASAGGTAYAHTINGHTYNYIALGVYEGYLKTMSGTQYLTSQSGVTPTVSTSLTTFRDKANNYAMDSSLGANAHSMVWNFYQWELYKYCCFAVMEGFNSQNFVGNGHAFGSTYAFQTGSLNVDYGPYAGNPGAITDSTSGTSYGSDSVKLFLENAWCGTSEWIDGVRYDGNNTPTLYIDSSSEPESATTGDYVTSKTFTLPNGYSTVISTDAETWGLGTNNNASATTGTTDFIYNSTSENHVLNVGGYSFAVYAVQFGVSFVDATTSPSNTINNIGSRLAFVMDADPASPPVNITITADATGYGTVDEAAVAATPGAIITIDGMEMDIGGTTVTASFTGSSDAQYTYSFLGWYNGDTLITSGTTVSGDMTVTAKFARTINNYTVSFASNDDGYGTVSSASVTVPYGTAIVSSTNTVTVGTSPDDTTVTATPTTSDAQYTYAFASWTGIPVGGYVIENTTVTATFTQTLNTYTITWVIGESSTTETYDYGATPTHENPVPPTGYYFAGWSPEIATVTGDQTYTALFSNMTVTFDAGKGTLDGDATKVVVIGEPIGELPSATAPMNYTFLGWFTSDGTEVTEDTIVTQDASFTLYAHYELVGSLQPVKAILDILPILMAVGLILGAVYVFISRPELATPNNLMYAIVGISAAILILGVFVIPIIGSAL